MRKLPSINLLVCFDAAARHLSFKRAAAELYVTPAAVGHQIRALEKALNTPLFVRLNRAIALTPAGLQYHQQIADALRTLRHASRAVLEQKQLRSLVIHSSPYLTNVLLVPHLRAFKERHPGLKIRIESRVERVALDSGELQIAIRHGKKPGHELCYEEITPVRISPVCAPNYDMTGPISLIQLSTDPQSWAHWQAEWGMQLNFHETLDCDGLQAVIDMAEQGMGVAMGYFPILNPQLKTQKLVLLYPDKISELAPLYLAFARHDQHDAVLADFIAWFKAIVKTFDA